MSKTYIVTSYSYTAGVERYFKTLPKSGAIPLIIQFGESSIEYPENAIVKKFDHGYMGNTGRFIPLYDIIKDGDFSNDDWFVFTDTHDVFFQRPIPDLSHVGAHILVAYEGKKFKEVDFWKIRVPSSLLEEDVYNVGSFAMRGKVLLQFLLQIKRSWDQFKEWYFMKDNLVFPYEVEVSKNFIASIFNSYTDTVLFNQFIKNKYYEELPGLFGCVAFNGELGRMKKVKRTWTTSDDKVISIVHENGSTARNKYTPYD